MSLCDYIYDVHRQKGNIFRKREQINYIGRKKVEEPKAFSGDKAHKAGTLNTDWDGTGLSF